MKQNVLMLAVLAIAIASTQAQETVYITEFDPGGTMTMSGFLPGTTTTVEWASSLNDPARTNWRVLALVVVTNHATSTEWPRYFRARGTPDTQMVGGLLAHYPFTGDADDESGNNHFATIFGATPGTDRSGNGGSAYVFNGLGDYMHVDDGGNQLNFDVRSNRFTVALWARLDSLDTDQTLVMDRASGTNDPSSFRVYVLPGRNVFVANCWDGVHSMHVPGTTVLETGTWYHVAMVADTSRILLYVNGVRELGEQIALHASNEYIPDIFGSTVNQQAARTFGKLMPYDNGYFHGALDDIRIYNYALSADDVSRLFQLP